MNSKILSYELNSKKNHIKRPNQITRLRNRIKIFRIKVKR